MVVDGSQDFWDVSSGNHLQHLFFFARCPVPSILYPVLPTHDTGFRPAASAGPVVTKGFGTCDSLPVVLGASPSSPTTPEFVGAPGQHPATPGSARSVPVSWPPLARLRLDSGFALLSDSSGQGVSVPVLLSRPVDNFEFILCQPLQPAGYLPFRFLEVPEPPQFVVVCAGCELSAVQVRPKVARSPNEG
ncbi:hypothetical protein T02_11682 [Trichinella nativa]|uniref:Uncharacterized protein n=1 Tax=Trichinella nativa TaxID=6335 RepID=A0A0V1KN02_9BILA|nr:hypothetical protein T02_11682 [Trichinella nativa]